MELADASFYTSEANKKYQKRYCIQAQPGH